MANPVIWFEVIGSDGAGLRSFYGDMFGWSFQDVEGMDYGMVEAGEGGIGGGVGSAPDGSGGHQTFYVSVDDVGGALEKAESLGGTKVMGPITLPMGGTIGLFNDPEGHTIGLFKGPEGQ